MPAGGSEATTTPCGLVGLDVDARDDEALALERGLGVRERLAGHVRHRHRLRAARDVDAHLRALAIRVAGCGCCAVTVSGAPPRRRCTIFGSRPSSASAVTAVVTSWPTTFGTCTCGLPGRDASVSTVEPLPTFEPPRRVLLGDLPRGTVSLGCLETRGVRPGLLDLQHREVALQAAARRARRPACSRSADPGSSCRGTSRRSRRR